MKAIFLCIRTHSNITTDVGFLSSRVKELKEGDWKKLVRLLINLMKTKDEVLTLEADDTQTLTWYIDTVFVIHHDMKIKLEQCLH